MAVTLDLTSMYEEHGIVECQSRTRHIRHNSPAGYGFRICRIWPKTLAGYEKADMSDMAENPLPDMKKRVAGYG